MRDAGLFRDRIALITGGAGGIGRALGEVLVARGARVVLADLDLDRADAAARAISTAHAAGRGRAASATTPPARALSLDVTDAAQVARAVDDVEATEGPLDYLFNNAGIAIVGEMQDTDLDDWQRMLAVNLRGVIHGVYAAYPRMVTRGAGHIVNTACVGGLIPTPLSTAYAATKHGVIGLSTSLRCEGAAHGVRVSVICPGPVATEMFASIETRGIDKDAMLARIPAGFLAPERCARAILRGLRRNRAIIPVTGYSHLSWWLYRLSPRAYLALLGALHRRVRPALQALRPTAATRPPTDDASA
ncbi:MAG: SDR family oxidoreductase [Acidobacteriota bacterium]